MRGDERLELHAVIEDPHEGRIGREIDPVALGIDDLRHERDVGEAVDRRIEEHLSRDMGRRDPRGLNQTSTHGTHSGPAVSRRANRPDT